MGFFKETKNSQTYYVSYPKNNPLISIILIKIQLDEKNAILSLFCCV